MEEGTVPLYDRSGPPDKEVPASDGPVREGLGEGRSVPRRVVPDPEDPPEDLRAGDDPAHLQHAEAVHLRHRGHRDPAGTEGRDARRRVREGEVAERLVHEEMRVEFPGEVQELPEVRPPDPGGRRVVEVADYEEPRSAVRGLAEPIDVERPPVPAVAGHLDDVRAEPPRAVPERGVHRGVHDHPSVWSNEGRVHDEVRLRCPGRDQHVLPRNPVQRRNPPSQGRHPRDVPPAEVELRGQVPVELPDRERGDV